MLWSAATGGKQQQQLAPINYPTRAPRSRAILASLNCLLDESLSRLRVASRNEGFLGPVHKEGAKKDDLDAESKFDAVLARLLNQSYIKVEALVAYIHEFAGTAELQRTEDSSNLRLLTAAGLSSIPPPQPKTMRELNAYYRAELLEERRVRKATEKAAREVLSRSRAERTDAELESLMLRQKVESLMTSISDRERRDAEAAAAEKEAKEAAAAAQAAAVEAQERDLEERRAAGLSDPLTAEEAAMEIQRLKHQVAAQKQKMEKTIDHLLDSLERKKNEIRLLNEEIQNTCTEQRREALLMRDQFDALASSLDAVRIENKRLAEELAAATNADDPTDWWHDCASESAQNATSVASALRAVRSRRVQHQLFIQGRCSAVVIDDTEVTNMTDVDRLNWALHLAYDVISFKVQCDRIACKGEIGRRDVEIEDAADLYFLERHHGCPGRARGEMKRMFGALTGFLRVSPPHTRLTTRLKFLCTVFKLRGHRAQTNRFQATIASVVDWCFQGLPLKSVLGKASFSRGESGAGGAPLELCLKEACLVSRRQALASILLSGLPPEQRIRSVGADAGNKSPSKGKSKAPLLHSIQAELTTDPEPKSPPGALEPVADVFYDPEAWRCPLITGVCAANRYVEQIQSFVRSVSSLSATPYKQQSIDASRDEGAAGAVETCRAHRGIPDFEICIDLDALLELILEFFAAVAEERITELEFLFKSFAKNRHKEQFARIDSNKQEHSLEVTEGDDPGSHQTPSAILSSPADPHRALQHRQSTPSRHDPNPYDGLLYDGFRQLVERIRISRKEDRALLDEGDTLERFRFLHSLALPHSAYDMETKDDKGDSDLTQQPFEFLRDAEAFALNFWRDEIFSTRLNLDPLVLIEKDPIAFAKTQDHNHRHRHHSHHSQDDNE